MLNSREEELCILIYEREKEHLNWYIWKIYPTMNREDTFDIMQDVWRILSENIETVGMWSVQDQWYWLMTVCRNRIVSMERKRKHIINWNTEFQDRMDKSVCFTSMEDMVIDKVMAEDVLSKLTKEDKKFLFWKFSSTPEKKRKSNAENCKTYRMRKKLNSMIKELGWEI